MRFSIVQKSIPNFVPALLVRKCLFFLVLFTFYTFEICFIIKLYKTNRESVQKSYTNFVILRYRCAQCTATSEGRDVSNLSLHRIKQATF